MRGGRRFKSHRNKERVFVDPGVSVFTPELITYVSLGSRVSARTLIILAMYHSL